MKILIVGDWRWAQYEEAFSRGLEACGMTVSRFVVSDYFDGMFSRYELAAPIPGPSMLRLNRDIVARVKEERPEFTLFWRPTHIFPSTVQTVRRQDTWTVSYNNDDPFGPRTHGNVPWHHHLLWFWYTRSLSMFDSNFFYRVVNCEEALGFGARHVDVLLPYFQPWVDRPMLLSEEERKKFNSEVVFVGHFESDQRVGHIRSLVEAGIDVKIWSGKDWGVDALGDMYNLLGPTLPAYGSDYARALCGAVVCLVFLSKMNRDTYTRRCFEIPACGRVMLAERTDDLLRLFVEDEEACFFSSSEELVAKAEWLIENPEVANRIAAAGLRRVWESQHDVFSRAKWFADKIISLRRARSANLPLSGYENIK
jgi:spore maturation protein CgeB